MNDGPKSRLALHDDVWHTHLAAESWKIHDQFDRVNVMSDHDKRCFFGLNEGNGVVQTIFDKERLLSVLEQRCEYGI